MAATPPLLPTHGGGTGRFRVPLQKRFERYFSADTAKALLFAPSPIPANRQHPGSTTHTVHNGKPRLVIEELIYPGGEARLAFGKFAYVVHLGRREFLAEISYGHVIVTAAVTWRTLPKPNDPEAKRKPGSDDWYTEFGDHLAGVPLDGMRPGDSTADIGCFLSPHPLNQQAMEMLLGAVSTKASGTDPSPALVKPVWSHPKPGYVALVDPFEWAEEACNDFFHPLLTEYQAWALEDQRQAGLTIAGIVKAWQANGDPADVTNELKTQPAAHIAAYEAEEKRRRSAAEEACAYLVSCLDAVEHEVVEAALLDAPTKEGRVVLRSYAMQHWCVVLDSLSQCAPGREFLALLVQSPHRAPGRFLLKEDSALGFGDYFATARWGLLGAMGIVKELGGIWIARMAIIENTPQATIRLKVRRLFENLGILFLTEPRQIYHDLIENAPLDKPFQLNATQRVMVERWVWHHDQFQPPASTKDIERELKSLADEKREGSFTRLSKAMVPAKIVIEVLNLGFNWAEFTRNPDPDGRAVASLAGAAVDFAAMLVDTALFAKEALRFGSRQLGDRMKGTAGVLAIVSGVLDCYEQIMRAQDAAGGRDYGKEVGHVIGAVGAGMVAVGGVLTVAGLLWGETTIAGSGFGPWGAAIGAAGGLFLAGGTVVSGLLKLNAYEQYARHCFLGTQAGAARISFPWSPVALPAQDEVEQLLALNALLANFRVKASGLGSPLNGPGVNGLPLDMLELHFGFSSPAAELELEMEQHYRHAGTGRTEFYRSILRYRFNATAPVLDLDRCTMIPRLGDFAVKRRDKDRSVERVTLAIRPLSFNAAGRPAALFEDTFAQHKGNWAPTRSILRARLLNAIAAPGGAKAFAAPLSKRLTIDTMQTDNATSADDGVLDKI